MRTLVYRLCTLALVGSMILALTLLLTRPASAASVSSPEATYIVVYDSPAHVDRTLMKAHGHTIVSDLGNAGILIVRSNNPADLTHLVGVTGVAHDRLRMSVPPEEAPQVSSIVSANMMSRSGCASTTRSCRQQWDLARIHVPQAWKTTQGSARVKVAVLDTGLLSSHEEVGANYDIAESRSFVQPSNFCSADANTFSSIEDFQGHGTWTNLHVAGINGPLMTGIAPRTTLINVRVLGACGFGLDSWVLSGMLYANEVGASIESMSLAGYLCADGVVGGSFYCGTIQNVDDGPILWGAYVQLVKYLRAHGTIVVAAASNEHVQLNAEGRVVSVGSLAVGKMAPDPSNDLRGLAVVPGGVPGVMTVAAVNRVTAASMPGETKFGQYGVGRHDQLTYYSNYGSRIDVSAPGGARNDNVPRSDCLSNKCARLTSSSSTASDNPGDFGAWAFDATGNPCDICYVYIQGTSMATPQVAGVAALVLAAHPGMDVNALAELLHSAVTHFGNSNRTPAIASDPSKPTYNYDEDYGGPAISTALMGTGVIDAALAVSK
jgi:subtilisin family serine protease